MDLADVTCCVCAQAPNVWSGGTPSFRELHAVLMHMPKLYVTISLHSDACLQGLTHACCRYGGLLLLAFGLSAATGSDLRFAASFALYFVLNKMVHLPLPCPEAASLAQAHFPSLLRARQTACCCPINVYRYLGVKAVKSGLPFSLSVREFSRRDAFARLQSHAS